MWAWRSVWPCESHPPNGDNNPPPRPDGSGRSSCCRMSDANLHQSIKPCLSQDECIIAENRRRCQPGAAGFVPYRRHAPKEATGKPASPALSDQGLKVASGLSGPTSSASPTPPESRPGLTARIWLGFPACQPSSDSAGTAKDSALFGVAGMMNRAVPPRSAWLGGSVYSASNTLSDSRDSGLSARMDSVVPVSTRVCPDAV